MKDETAQKKISITLPLPSIALKRFIEKAIQEEEFFFFALENPLGAMEECGVKLNVSAFLPQDFASFLGALSALREMVKKKQIKEVCFESIFGQAAEIRGVTIKAELTRGFYKEWDNRQAFSQKEKHFSAQQKFEQDRERSASSVKDLCQSEEVVILIPREFVGETNKSSETFRSQTREWDNADSVQTRRSDTGTTRGFEKSGQRSLQDLMSGPLIHPEDLAAISARLDAYAKIKDATDA